MRPYATVRSGKFPDSNKLRNNTRQCCRFYSLELFCLYNYISLIPTVISLIKTFTGSGRSEATADREYYVQALITHGFDRVSRGTRCSRAATAASSITFPPHPQLKPLPTTPIGIVPSLRRMNTDSKPASEPRFARRTRHIHPALRS